MYVALSLAADLPLVTGDDRLVRVLSGSGCHLIPLESVATT
jgi:predicted nucleic acid-binding protein